MTDFKKWSGGACPTHPNDSVDVVLRGFGLRENVYAREVTWEHGGRFASIEVTEWRQTPPHNHWKELATIEVEASASTYGVINLLRAHNDKRLRVKVEVYED